MTRAPALAVVGAGLAAAKAAEGARRAGFEGRIVLIGDEPQLPYERPPLSKSFLRGESDLEAALVNPADFYGEHDIEIVHDRAVAFDLVVRRIELASGSAIDFDNAVIATGAEPRRLAVAGDDLPGVHYLRTVDDAVRLREAVAGADRVAVIGGGWIGCEVAASIRQTGTNVVLIDRGSLPLQHVLGDTIGEVFRQLHAEQGVQLQLRATIDSIRGSRAVDAVVLGDGRAEEVDLVVVGIGVRPRTELAETTSALQVDNGIVVDEHLATGVPGVYAAGDVANAWHPHYGRHIRVEHWANALNQGALAGRNAVGGSEPYTRLPYFFSDQYDVGLEYVGYADPTDDVVVRGELETRQFVCFWHRDGIVTAAMALNVWDVVEDLKRIVATRLPIELARLENPEIPLTDLAA
jgi:3-phenylpropionate/trans-cinnamate dioxygenase ferredoxin reductase subunit